MMSLFPENGKYSSNVFNFDRKGKPKVTYSDVYYIYKMELVWDFFLLFPQKGEYFSNVFYFPEVEIS